MIPVLLYASDTWHLNNKQERRILALENIKHPLVTKISNEKVRRITGQPIVTDIIRTRR